MSMANSAALLSTQTGLSALLGGTVGISANTGTNSGANTATNGGQTADFSAILSGQTGLMTSHAPKTTLSLAAATPDATATADAGTDVAVDAAPATSGKNLPLAALTAAVLPVPITLAAWVKAPGDQPTATGMPDGATPDDTAQDDDATVSDPFADASTVNLDARNIALMAMMHGALPTVPSVMPAPQVASSTATDAGIAPTTLASATMDSSAQIDAALPRPGFALLGTNAAGAATMDTNALQTRLASAQSSVTLQADTAVAMTDLQRAQGVSDGPGFTLLAKAQSSTLANTQATVIPASATATYAQPGFSVLSDTGTSAAATTAQPAVTLTADMSIVLAPTANATHLASATQDTGTQDTDEDALAPATAARPVRLASARSTLPSTLQGHATGQDSGQSASGDGTASSAFQTPATPSADGASMPDNAPSPLLHLASAGTANVAQSLAATGGAATFSTTLAASSGTAGQTGTTDMAALVDRLVEARAAARSGLGSQSVQASVTHADFGRVSLRFNQDDDGLSVSMTSRDPGFAPAAQAALAQAPAVAASGQSQSTGQQGSHQQGSGQPGQQWTQAGLQSNTGGQSNTGSNGQAWAQNGQNAAPFAQPTTAQQTRATTLASSSGTGSSQTSVRTRGGILA